MEKQAGFTHFHLASCYLTSLLRQAQSHCSIPSHLPLAIYYRIGQCLASRILLLGRLLVTSHLSGALTTTIGL
jgi:hypothetical protein